MRLALPQLARGFAEYTFSARREASDAALTVPEYRLDWAPAVRVMMTSLVPPYSLHTAY